MLKGCEEKESLMQLLGIKLVFLGNLLFLSKLKMQTFLDPGISQNPHYTGAMMFPTGLFVMVKN